MVSSTNLCNPFGDTCLESWIELVGRRPTFEPSLRFYREGNWAAMAWKQGQ
jgi:hypothetical protein